MSDPLPAGTFLKPVSAELARVLAQAADSAFAPATLYVVARYQPADPGTTLSPYDVQQPVATFAEAEARVEELKKRYPDVEYGIFGPFQNDTPLVPPLGQSTVAHLLVTPQGGVVKDPIPIPGQEYDALFYSVQAVEKFVVPYHVQEYGADFGSYVLKAFKEAPLALMAHLPWSEEVEVTGAPQQDAGTGAGLRLPARARYVPAFFKHDASGTMQPQPLYPPASGPA